jgi:hypothetical protein
MAADHARPGDEDVLAKVAGDLAAGHAPDPATLGARLAAAQRSAWAQTLPHHH